ncbi:MAG: hypothetical protein ACI9HK_005259, partial [Pirellulaceae bacterium]
YLTSVARKKMGVPEQNRAGSVKARSVYDGRSARDLLNPVAN